MGRAAQAVDLLTCACDSVAPAAGLPGKAVAHTGMMTTPLTPPQPRVNLQNGPDYRESYANSVQMRVSLWDFFLMFGIANQTAPDAVTIQNSQGIYLSPPQAKALLNLLTQNVRQYETAFGEIKLEAQGQGEVVQ
jgi:hypothetical protein